MYKQFFKRAIDITGALVGLVIASPLFLLIGVLLAFANRGKIFFLQERPGKNCKVFRIIKFQTMNDRHNAAGNLLPDAERLTKIGKFVRSISLDEIPQLLNVLKGDMSLIGPRPLLTDYLPLYSVQQMRRHEIRPGITGWAQCHGRNAISWTEKFNLDIWYVDHISLSVDLQVLILTIKKVFLREGISSSSSATAESFNGHN